MNTACSLISVNNSSINCYSYFPTSSVYIYFRIMNNNSEKIIKPNFRDIYYKIRWPAIIIIFLIAYRILGLEGDQVLVGLFCRNTAWLILAVIFLRKAVKMRRKKPGSRSEKAVRSLCLGLGTILMGVFLYLQANVCLDMLVPAREAVLKDCVLDETRIPGFLTGYNRVLTGVNNSGYTKKLPLTPALTERALDELDRKKVIHVIFYEHVRRVVYMYSTENEYDPAYNFWQ